MELGSGLTQREANTWLQELPLAPGETPWLVVKATAAQPVVDVLVLTDRRLYGLRRGFIKPEHTLALRHGRAIVGRVAGRHLWVPVDGGAKAIWALFETVPDLERFCQVLGHVGPHARMVVADGVPDLDGRVPGPPVDEDIFPQSEQATD